MKKLMQNSVIYDIIRDGDRHLRGKIAELVFKRVRPRLLKRPCCCNTRELTYFLMEYAHFKEEISFLLGEKPPPHSYIMWVSPMEKEGLEEIRNTLSEEEIRKLGKFCLLCLKEGEKEVQIQIDTNYRLFYLCSDCLRKCTKLGFIRSINNTYEVNSNAEYFSNYVKKLSMLLSIERYPGVIAVLSRLDSRSRIFLYKAYKEGRSQYPFDYVCVDESGNKYLVDVTSVKQINKRPAKLSKIENQIAAKAKEAGFKILVPVVRFLKDWQVQVEFTET